MAREQGSMGEWERDGDGNGSPPPAFAGASSRREDNGGGVGTTGGWQWATGLLDSGLRRNDEGGGIGGWGGGDAGVVGRGSPHSRGQEGSNPYPPSSRGRALTVPRSKGKGRGAGTGEKEDSSAPLRFARNEMWGRGRGMEMGLRIRETFARLPKRIPIAVWDDSCHSQIKGCWIPAFAGMTEVEGWLREALLRGSEDGSPHSRGHKVVIPIPSTSLGQASTFHD